MESFEYFCKTRFSLGRRAESRAGELIKQQGGRSVLIIYGKKYAPQSGLLERLRRSLDRAGLFYAELGGVVSNPRVDKVREGLNMCRELKVDFILAVGGGSVIDSAKAIAAGRFCQGDVWELYEGKQSVYRALSVGVILTIPGSGSECSEVSVLSNDEDPVRKKRFLKAPCLIPSFCILNPELTYTLSPKATANGAVAMLCRLMEGYFSNTASVRISDHVCESLMADILGAMRVCQDDLQNYDARSDLMWAGALTFSGLPLKGRICDKVPSQLEFEISLLRDKPHGNAYSIIMPAYLSFVLRHNVLRMAQFAHKVLCVPFSFENPVATAKEGIKKWYEIMEDFKLPCLLPQLGIGPRDVKTLVKGLPFDEEGRIGNYVKLNEVDCEAVYSLAIINPYCRAPQESAIQVQA